MNSQIGNKIKNRREILNFSQEYVAEKLGISQPAYAKIEKGQTKIDIDRLNKISEILSIDILDLLDSKYVLNTFNNKDSSQAIGIVENLHQDNREISNQLINQLKEENSILRSEVDRLLSLIENILKK